MRVWSSGFESISDFAGFYITPPGYTNSDQALVSTIIKSGISSHKGWVKGSYSENHRAYPTVQLYKTIGKGFQTPCVIDLWVYLNAQPIVYGQWWSFFTLSKTIDLPPTFAWDGVLVNVGSLNDPETKGCVHLMHVPSVGLKNWTYQNTTNPFPFRQWVKLSVLINFNPTYGYAKLWQDGILMSSASVTGGHGLLEQAHFGLYCEKSITFGSIFNDDLVISEVSVPNTPTNLVLKYEQS